ncbi:MAG: FtsK/SpoIIIE domain-containing protein, partial [Acidimicrobiales bacterium]
ERWRRSRGTPAEVRAPLGAAPRRGAPAEPFAIDLVADGPHLLIGGTTGSGKSELLRTLVLSLALHHPPDTVSFLLVDYKGGSAFDACADLPHTVGLVTDLDHHLAGRALVSLDAEIRRREQLLRQAGVADLTTGAVPSLARLVVVIDEFATLAAELPGFLDALVDVAQRGRSLGVHLVLATQRPHGAVNDRIRTNTNLRIALRMLDRAESSDVIDDPAAARVPRDRPGRGFARLGHDELLPFQAALTEPTALRSLVDRIAEAAACTGTAPPRAPWLPPLPPTVALDDLDHLDHLDHLDQPGSDQDGGDDDETGPALAVTIALADEPARQRRRPWAWAPDQGNLLVYGMPGSGTTTALITVALAFTRRHAPADGHLYAVADGSGGLGVVAGLPPVGAVVDADDGRRQARLVRMLADELDRRRGTGRASRPAVVVLIDDLPGLLRRFDTLSGHHVVDDLHRVFRDGPAVAIHLVATADRPGTIPVALAARTTERLVLRLADPFDLTALGLRPRGEHAPGSEPHRPPPGRGVVGQGPGIEVQVAREPDPSAAVRTISQRHAPDPDHVDVDVDRIDRLMTHRPWTVGELPGRVDVARLPPARVRDGDGGRRALVLPLGIGDRDLQPRGLELHDGDHALIVGPARSGRSTALCVLARSIVGPTGRPRAPSVHATVIALTPRPSPLRDCSGVVAVPDVDRLLSALARAGDADDTLVLIDDADQVADPVGAMAALSTSTRAGLHIVAAGRTDRLRTTYGHWTSWLRSSGHGLVLRPDVDRDGDLWGIRLPRDAESRRNDGRGHLLTDGEVELIQVATPDRS